MFSLTYDLWKEIIEEIAQAHDSLFTAMHQAAEELQLSTALIDDLKSKRELTIANDPWELRLTIEFIEDEINGFIIYLDAKEPQETLEEIKANVASDNGFSLEEIEGFELEHGLDMQEEIFVEMEESYGVRAEVRENEVIYELVIFNSQDIDNSLSSDLSWLEDHKN
ncbi:MAG: hypothetical protein M0Q13_04810 [Methanothrix sp.]|jgi:hypothetical protein|nr:hypothetical protein [Methanothrix sp.]